MKRRDRGQVLVLFAGALVAIVGVTALAIDVTSVYSLQRYERTVADSAALAGAQDLVTKNNRADPTTSQQRQARQDALDLAARTLGGTPTGPSCNANNDIVLCPISGTPFVVTIRTPSPSAMTVSAARAVQVTIRQPDVPLTFARLFNQHDWNVAITSVAGIGFGSRYALITLRPPSLNGSGADTNQNDVLVNGGTVVTITGDIGSNTNAVISGQSASGQNSQIVFPSNTDYRLDYYDPVEAWTEPPLGHHVTALIPDPGYPFPSRTGVQPGGQDTTNCQAAINSAIASGYKGHSSSSDPTLTYTLDITNTTCWKPGSYSFDIGSGKNCGPKNNPACGSRNSTAVLLEPGVYFLDGGLSIQGTLIGGYTPGSYDPTSGQPLNHNGVALIFPEANNGGAGAFTGNNATLVALNAGTCITSKNPGACIDIATPAIAPDGTVLQVTFRNLSAGDVVVPETMLVARDGGCVVQQPYPSSCQDTKNNSINLPGGGALFVIGVQYAPSDNVVVSGGSSGAGFLGQIVAWSVKYAGGSQIGEVYPGRLGNGTLRLDTACAGPNTVCNNP